MTDEQSTKIDTGGTDRVLSAPILRVDLAAETSGLRQEEPWRAHGHNARTLIKHSDFRIVLIFLKRGASMTEHHTDHSFSLQTLVGHVRVKLPEETVDLPTGHLVAVGKAIQHDVEAEEDSVILLSMSWSEK